MTLSKDSLDRLERAVRALAADAAKAQPELDIQTKSDGSPVTQIDLMVSKRLIRLVSSLFPSAAIISEEHATDHRPDAPCTFVIDPIDGTDVYSQGFPSWCVSVGILDGDKVPVGAMICAPRFGIATSGGLFVRLDPGGTLLVDGKQFAITTEKETAGQVVMGSDALRHMTVERFSGKIRCFGSTIIHLLCPVLVDKIHAAIQSVGYVWDFASAHAVLRASGMDIYHADGSPFTYTDAFLDRQPVRECLYAGTKACTDRLRQVLTARTP